MKLILIRHGKTEANIARIMQGHSHGVLSEEGKDQVEKLAERLKNENIDLIISSDLGRALNTAKAVADFHPKAKFVTDNRLRERDIGSLEGEEYRENLDWDNIPEDVETEKKMLERVFELFNETLGDNFGKTVLFAAHGGINCALLGKIIDGDVNKVSNWRRQENTCVNILDVDENGKADVKLLNCTEHLK